MSASYPVTAFAEIKKLPLAPVVGMWYHTFRSKGFGDSLILVLLRVVFHFQTLCAGFKFFLCQPRPWPDITIGIIFSSIVIPFLVQPSEAVQEGFDGRFCFVGRFGIILWGFLF